MYKHNITMTDLNSKSGLAYKEEKKRPDFEMSEVQIQNSNFELLGPMITTTTGRATFKKAAPAGGSTFYPPNSMNSSIETTLREEPP
mmetsp:Transcript_41576/g.63442  ORF Transcript_41576/g.63442 Transcript_41576/m.63442 type:complete len:87 (+) Transcript_41576:312-572(+)